MYDEIRTVINAAQGLIVWPGRAGHLPFGASRPALYVRFDIRVSAPYDEESGSIPLLVSHDLHMIVTQPHHVFFSTVEEGWAPLRWTPSVVCRLMTPVGETGSTATFPRRYTTPSGRWNSRRMYSPTP